MSQLEALYEQKKALEEQIAAAKVESARLMLQELKARGLTVDDLAKLDRSGRRAGPSIPPKYRDAAGNTWSGRGFQPVWLRNALAGGAALESFLIAS